MGRTALGTAVGASDSLTKASVAVAVGETVIVIVGCSGFADPTGVTWDGQALTLDRPSKVTATEYGVSIWSKKITTGGGTGDIVATFEFACDNALVALKHDQLNGFDKGATNDAGSGTAADSGFTGTLTQADEFTVGGVMNLVDSSVTWIESRTGGQLANGTTYFLEEGYLTVSATTSLRAAGFITSSEWAASIATYKIVTAAARSDRMLMGVG